MGKKTGFSRREFIINAALAGACALAAPHTMLAASRKTAGQKPVSPPHQNPKIALIIDDVGYNTQRVEAFLRLSVPITFSILPHLIYSQKLADVIHCEGHEVMLHQPMEPRNAEINPGPGAIYLKHSPEICRHILKQNIDSIPFAAGVNNHMGSRFTESREKMQQTLDVFKQNRMFFIDSFTTSNSLGFDTARQLHMKAAYRNIFIDNVHDKTYICSQLKKLKKHAQLFGHAIGIGHPRRETVDAVGEFIDAVQPEGIELHYISDILYTKEHTACSACDSYA